MGARLLALVLLAGLIQAAGFRNGATEDEPGELEGWFASREISLSAGFTTGSGISLWSSPSTDEALVVAVVIRNHDAPPLVAESVELVADERRATVDCALEGIDSQVTTFVAAGPSYDQASTAFAVSNCAIGPDLLEALLQAEHIEAQIHTAERSLKRKVFSPKQVRRLQNLYAVP